jgi:hypothetical protein
MRAHLQLDRYGFTKPVPKFDNRHQCHCVMCRHERAERLRQGRVRRDWALALLNFAFWMSLLAYYVMPTA